MNFIRFGKMLLNTDKIHTIKIEDKKLTFSILHDSREINFFHQYDSEEEVKNYFEMLTNMLTIK